MSNPNVNFNTGTEVLSFTPEEAAHLKAILLTIADNPQNRETKAEAQPSNPLLHKQKDWLLAVDSQRDLHERLKTFTEKPNALSYYQFGYAAFTYLNEVCLAKPRAINDQVAAVLHEVSRCYATYLALDKSILNFSDLFNIAVRAQLLRPYLCSHHSQIIPIRVVLDLKAFYLSWQKEVFEFPASLKTYARELVSLVVNILYRSVNERIQLDQTDYNYREKLAPLALHILLLPVARQMIADGRYINSSHYDEYDVVLAKDTLVTLTSIFSKTKEVHSLYVEVVVDAVANYLHVCKEPSQLSVNDLFNQICTFVKLIAQLQPSAKKLLSSAKSLLLKITPKDAQQAASLQQLIDAVGIQGQEKDKLLAGIVEATPQQKIQKKLAIVSELLAKDKSFNTFQKVCLGLYDDFVKAIKPAEEKAIDLADAVIQTMQTYVENSVYKKKYSLLIALQLYWFLYTSSDEDKNPLTETLLTTVRLFSLTKTLSSDVQATQMINTRVNLLRATISAAFDAWCANADAKEDDALFLIKFMSDLVVVDQAPRMKMQVALATRRLQKNEFDAAMQLADEVIDDVSGLKSKEKSSLLEKVFSFIRALIIYVENISDLVERKSKVAEVEKLIDKLPFNQKSIFINNIKKIQKQCEPPATPVATSAHGLTVELPDDKGAAITKVNTEETAPPTQQSVSQALLPTPAPQPMAVPPVSVRQQQSRHPMRQQHPVYQSYPAPLPMRGYQYQQPLMRGRQSYPQPPMRQQQQYPNVSGPVYQPYPVPPPPMQSFVPVDGYGRPLVPHPMMMGRMPMYYYNPQFFNGPPMMLQTPQGSVQYYGPPVQNYGPPPPPVGRQQHIPPCYAQRRAPPSPSVEETGKITLNPNAPVFKPRGP